jgi:hypothetical protein
MKGKRLKAIDEKQSGDEGVRTPDLGVANAALSRLSYIPMFFVIPN